MIHEDEEQVKPNYENYPLVDLAELIDNEIMNYNRMLKSPQKRHYKAFITTLVNIYNLKAKQKIFKDMWWIN